MKVGIKYCGGCNPRFSRGDFVRKLKDKYKNSVLIESFTKGYAYDLVIAICGCDSACVSLEDIKSAGRIVLVSKEDDILIIDEILKIRTN